MLRALDVTVASLETVSDVDGRLTEWLRRNGAHAVLVRPDFYVFGSVPVAARTCRRWSATFGRSWRSKTEPLVIKEQ